MSKPILQIRHRFRLRLILLYFLYTLITLSIYLSFRYHLILLFGSIALIAMLLLVRFKSIYLYQDKLSFRDRCIFPFFNESRIVDFEQVERMVIYKKHVDLEFLLIDILDWGTMFRGQTGPLTIGFHFKDGSSYSMAIFGTKKQQQEFLQTLQKLPKLK